MSERCELEYHPYIHGCTCDKEKQALRADLARVTVERDAAVGRAENSAKTCLAVLDTELCDAHTEEAKHLDFLEFCDRAKSIGCAWCNATHLKTAREALEAARHALVTSDGLTCADGLGDYNDGLNAGLDANAAWECFVEDTWVLDNQKAIDAVDTALASLTRETGQAEDESDERCEHGFGRGPKCPFCDTEKGGDAK